MTNEEKLQGLHALVVELEAEARALVRSGASRDGLMCFVESVIIAAADACKNFGPCPSCDSARGS